MDNMPIVYSASGRGGGGGGGGSKKKAGKVDRGQVKNGREACRLMT